MSAVALAAACLGCPRLTGGTGLFVEHTDESASRPGAAPHDQEARGRPGHLADLEGLRPAGAGARGGAA